MPGLLTYWHTIRHLRPIQLYGRIWFRFAVPRLDLQPAPPVRLLRGHGWIKPARRRPSLVGPDRFCFLNEKHNLSDCGWDNTYLSKLWRYNLHYFDDLNAQDASSRMNWHRALLLRWVLENPPGVGTGWEPYPTSLRIGNWIKWSLNGNILPAECLESLAVQVRWLYRRLEMHLLGNHLFTNAKALVFAGLFFEGSEADDWLEKGLHILEREVREQILSDGGQFERSTMYHALALEDMLDLNNVITAFSGALPPHWNPTIKDWWKRIDLMRDWLAAMCHPDGEISFFNDAAIGIAPPPIELEEYAGRLGFAGRPVSHGLTHLAESGYIRIEQYGAVAMLDVAPVGPDYLPAHAHADTLSFELSLFGQRFFVNSGTSCYGNTVERLHQRRTSAHNTITLDGQDSSEVWSSFRVARRARPVGLKVIRNGRDITVRCAHDGYRRLTGRPIHQRQWLFSSNMLVVEDRVCGSFRGAEARFYLHPAVKPDELRLDSHEKGRGIFCLPQGQKILFMFEGGKLHQEVVTWHPEFGRKDKTLCLVVDFIGPVLRTQLKWTNAA